MKKTTRREFLRNLGGLLVGAGLAYNNGCARGYSEDEKVEGKEEKKPKYSLEDYVNAIVEIESHGNARAERYEKHLDDYSYGLGQLLTRTAKELERRYSELPRLGESAEEIKENLFNQEINRAYTTRLFKEELDFYQNPDLAVAAYNAGHLTPRNALCQRQLNELYKTNLKTDGIVGAKTKEIVKKFQEEYRLTVDGKIGNQTYAKLQEVYYSKFPNQEKVKGIVPINNYTPNHVRKFKSALENIRR